MRCQHWIASARSVCGSSGAKQYMSGLRCPAHTPAALAGRPAVVVDPEQTMTALQRKAGRRPAVFSRADSALIDDRAIRSGKSAAGRRSFYETRRLTAELDSARKANR